MSAKFPRGEGGRTFLARSLYVFFSALAGSLLSRTKMSGNFGKGHYEEHAC